jgi:tetratricopeptide (TPR) repeat protein
MATRVGGFAEAWRQHQAGKLEQAEKLYRRILRSDPSHLDTLHMLGVLLCQQGLPDMAEGYLRQALALKPQQPEIQNNLGNVLRLQGKLEEAIACHRQALRVRPDFVDALNNLGNILRRQEDLEEAISCFRRALELNPASVEAHNNLGIAYRKQGKLDEAAACYRHVLALKADHAEAHYNLGLTVEEQGQLDEAVACYRQAIAVKPALAEAHNSLGVALVEQGKLDEAIACYRQALALKPAIAEAHYNLGNALHRQRQLDEAVTCYRRALDLRCDYADAHYNCSLVWLLQGNFAQGWPEYEWRWRRTGAAARPFAQPLWDGSPLQGQTILLHAEQGLGDTLQFVRYAPRVRACGGNVIVECQAPLVRLLEACPGIDQVVARNDPLPEFQVQAPLLSLPGIFHTCLENILADVPYLRRNDRLVEQWRQRLGPASGRKIGITWQGNPAHQGDQRRSVPLAHFAALAAIEGICLYSLQVGSGAEQLAAADFAITDLGGKCPDFAHTAAIIQNLDLVICVDTAIAHLAGALGVPVWVALQWVPDWRWLLDGDGSPWYPSVRLFRQVRRGEWDEVFARIVAALREPVQPISNSGPRRG